MVDIKVCVNHDPNFKDWDVNTNSLEEAKQLAAACAMISRGTRVDDWRTIPMETANRIFNRLVKNDEQPLEFVQISNHYLKEFGKYRTNVRIMRNIIEDYAHMFPVKLEGYRIISCEVPRNTAIHWRTHRSMLQTTETGRKKPNIRLDMYGLTDLQQDFLISHTKNTIQGATNVGLSNTNLNKLLPQQRLVWTVLGGTDEDFERFFEIRTRPNVEEVTKYYTQKLKDYYGRAVIRL